MENATFADLVKERSPEGGCPAEVWGRFSKANGSLIGAKGLAHTSIIYNAFVKWYGSGRSLYDMTEDEANRYVEFLAKNTSPTSVWKVSLPALAEIWRYALPLCANPWSRFRWDSMRNIVVPTTPVSGRVNTDTSLLDFAEKFFEAEASSGRKIERNSRGFMRHLMKHMGVRKVGDVTRKIAYEYAIKMHDDPKCKVVRCGNDRLRKFAAMWNALLPHEDNPFEDVTYADAMRMAKYNAFLETKGELSPTECLRALPPILWGQYVRKHAKCTRHRMSTLKSIFFRFWDNANVERPIQVTTEVAMDYTKKLCRDKSTWMDDLRELRAAWDLLMPNIINPWDTAMRQVMQAETPSPASPTTPPVIANSEETPPPTDGQVKPGREPEESPKAEQFTFGQIFENWKSSVDGRDFKKSTFDCYWRIMTYLRDYCSEHGIELVSKDTITLDFARGFEESMKPRVKFIRNIIGPLKIMWSPTFGMENPWRVIQRSYSKRHRTEESKAEEQAEKKTEPTADNPKIGFWTRLKAIWSWMFPR